MKKLLLLLGVVLLLGGCDASVGMRSKASVMSEDFVLQRLRYPATADFESLGVIWEPENEEGTKGVLIKKFTAKNAFGVPIQYIFKIKIEFLGGEWELIENWTYDYLIIEEIPSGKQEYYTPLT